MPHSSRFVSRSRPRALLAGSLLTLGLAACADDPAPGGLDPAIATPTDGGRAPARPDGATPPAAPGQDGGASPPDAGPLADASAADAEPPAFVKPLGICAPTSRKQIDAAIDDFHELGVTSVRVWVSINAWSGDAVTWQETADALKKYKAAGFHTVAAFVPEDGMLPSSTQYVDQVNHVVDHVMVTRDLKDDVDIWEIGNEPDHAEYWQNKSMSDYAKRFLLPAAKRFHSYGAKIANAAPSWNPDDLQKILDTPDGDSGATAFDQVDYVNLHLYRPNVNDLDGVLARLHDLAHGKPTMSTEWSMNKPSGGGDAAWSALIAEGWPHVHAQVDYAYYFIWMVHDSSHGGGGLVDASFAHRAPFWDMFSAF